jgi:DNA-directed RNA polymerase subunit H (RpoH/RPB5)
MSDIRYWTALKIIDAMMRDRGYESDTGDLSIDTIESFRRTHMSDNAIDYETLEFDFHNDKGDLTYVRFIDPNDKPKGKKATSADVKFIADLTDMPEQNKTGIFVIDQNLTPGQKDHLNTKYTFDIQVFHIDELQYNPMTHMFAPKIVVLSKEKQDNFFRKYGKLVPRNRLPQLADTDELARYYNLKPGQLIRVFFNSLMSETFGNVNLEYYMVEEDPSSK